MFSRSSAKRDNVCSRRRFSKSPNSARPLEDIREDLGLLCCVVDCVVCMHSIRAQGWCYFLTSGLDNWDARLDSKRCLNVKALRMIERRPGRGKSDKIPIKPCPVETERVGNEDRPDIARNSENPL